MGAPRWNIPSTGYNVESCSHARRDVASSRYIVVYLWVLFPRTRGCCCRLNGVEGNCGVVPTHAGMLLHLLATATTAAGCSHARRDVAVTSLGRLYRKMLFPRTQGCCGWNRGSSSHWCCTRVCGDVANRCINARDVVAVYC